MKIVEIWKLYESSPMYCKDVSEKRRNAVRTIWNEFASSCWSKPIKSLTSDLIASWLCKRCSLCSNKTYNDYLRIIRQVLNAILSKTGLHVNPANEVPVRKKNCISRKPYTQDEIDGVLAAICRGIAIPYNYKTHGKVVTVMRPYSIPYPQEIRLTIMLGAYCGMRCGDAVRMANTNYSNGFLTYTPSKTDKTSGKEVVVPVLKEELKEAFESCDGFLTPNVMDMHLKRPSELARLYHRIFEACGLHTRQHCDGRNNASLGGFHALRTSYACMCASAGVAIEVTRDVLGHTSTMTTDIYYHIDSMRKAMELQKIMSCRIDGGDLEKITHKKVEI